MSSSYTDRLLAALRLRGASVKDLRGKLPTNSATRFDKRDPAKLKGMVGHHSAGPPGGVKRFEQIARYHTGPNHVSPKGGPGIFYTLGIASDGTVGLFHDLKVATWSQGSTSQPMANYEHLGVLVVGDFASPGHAGGEPTPEQVHSFVAVVLACRDVWGASFKLSGHYAFGKPLCPGATLEHLIRALSAHVETPLPPREMKTLRDVQTALVELGFDPGVVDGLNGPNTRSAVARFQAWADLPITGYADTRTREEMLDTLKE